MAVEDAIPPAALLDLAGRLARDVRRLLDQHVQLLRLEVKDEVAQIAKGVALLAAAAVGAAIAVIFALLALGLWIGSLLGSTPAGLAIVAGALLLTGAVLAVVGTRLLQRLRFVPGVTRELRRDAAWIQHGM